MMSSTLFDLFHGEVVRECFSSQSTITSRKDSPDGIRTLRKLGREVGSRLVRSRFEIRVEVFFFLTNTYTLRLCLNS